MLNTVTLMCPSLLLDILLLWPVAGSDRFASDLCYRSRSRIVIYNRIFLRALYFLFELQWTVVSGGIIHTNQTNRTFSRFLRA